MKRIPLISAIDGSVRAWTLVSDRDYAWLNEWVWRLHSGGYAIARRTVLMHRLILGLEQGDPRQGDHENLDKLDNRRSNLRIASRAELDNGQNLGVSKNNTSGFRGVSFKKQRGVYEAYGMLNHRKHCVGYFATAEEADMAVRAFRAANMPYSTN